MTASHANSRPLANCRYRYLFSLLLVLFTLAPRLAAAQSAVLVPGEMRIATGIDEFDGASHFAATLQLRPPRRLRSEYLEIAIGGIATSGTDRLMLAIGPVWQVPLHRDRIALKLGFSPTLIGGSTIEGRDLGGNFHFTSSAAIETRFGTHRQATLAFRFQHTSNGGLNDTNPGMDMVGVSFGYSFSR